ncbi:ribosome biogenesis GTPase YlqF [Desulfitibacter alkalitolerans]|uniref:ribosome biogenesis GTPase YlqF n=1 Tax=Desulfitibacter alkalitolerans TaxID=264641 RepID=UPI000488882F|nr:ribosome biogenesis GTPase YlqF [Desulfitibacter alkalitolerans]
MVVQWYPGHMAKAKKTLKENIKMIDVVVELLDARIPASSQNPILKELTVNKHRIVVLNKEDLANPHITKAWINAFHNNGIKAIAVDSISKRGINETLRSIAQTPIRDSAARRLNIKRPVRAMVVGIPNVGKSMFINSLVGRSTAKTGNKPGVTKGNQWIKIKENVQLLDTPGILWPKFDNEETGLHLAYVNSIGPKAFDIEDIVYSLTKFLAVNYPNSLKERYNLCELLDDTNTIIKLVGKSRGFLLKGGDVDLRKTSETILKDFRDGKLGRISLETPEEREVLNGGN